MRKLISVFSLLLIFTSGAVAASSARQDGARRVIDAARVPSEGRTAADFVPRGWKSEGQEVSGDLNGDRVADVALRLVEDMPIENAEGVLNERQRALVILFGKAGGGFERAAVAPRLLLCSTCAGVLGDPEGGNITLEIKNGILDIMQMTGSREATERTHRFRHDPRLKRFRLIGEDVSTRDRLNGNSDSESTNYLTGLRVTKRYRAKRKGREPVLVSSTRKKVATTPRFIEDVDYEQ